MINKNKTYINNGMNIKKTAALFIYTEVEVTFEN